MSLKIDNTLEVWNISTHNSTTSQSYKVITESFMACSTNNSTLNTFHSKCRKKFDEIFRGVCSAEYVVRLVLRNSPLSFLSLLQSTLDCGSERVNPLVWKS
jgi:hypothetical protein